MDDSETDKLLGIHTGVLGTESISWSIRRSKSCVLGAACSCPGIEGCAVSVRASVSAAGGWLLLKRDDRYPLTCRGEIEIGVGSECGSRRVVIEDALC